MPEVRTTLHPHTTMTVTDQEALDLKRQGLIAPETPPETPAETPEKIPAKKDVKP